MGIANPPGWSNLFRRRICNPQQSVCLSMHPECFYLIFLSLCYSVMIDVIYAFKMKDKTDSYV